MITLSDDALTSLRQHHVSDEQLHVSLAMVECLRDAGDDVAADTRDEAFDDATSRGGLLYRRARNRILGRFDEDVTVTCDTTDNALHVRVGATAISFYSARAGLDNPSINGSRTKRRVVDESQMALDLEDQANIRRLVILHETSPDGLVRAAVGVLESDTKWSWYVTLYDRFALDGADKDERRGDAYDQRPEPEIAITRKVNPAAATSSP